MESAVKDIIFGERTSDPARFFEILPEDWQLGISPYWGDYCSTSRVLTLETAGEVIGGGITFLKPAPDTLSYSDIAQEFFQAGRTYFGFLWLSPVYRGNDLGSYWIKNLRLKIPDTKLWLSIEDRGLIGFYQKNGFTLLKEIKVDDATEWVMVD